MNYRKNKPQPVNIPVKLKTTSTRHGEDLSSKLPVEQPHKNPVYEIEDYRTIGNKRVQKFVVSRG